MKRIVKRAALLLCICFVLILVLGAALSVLHAGHDCMGEQCEICMHLNHLSDLLGRMRLSAMACGLFAVPGVFFAWPSEGRAHRPSTPVALRVQMNN